MITLGVLLFIVISIGFIVAVINHSKKWALALQLMYVREGERLFGDSPSWKDKWVRILLQVLIVFLATIIVLLVFSLFFGTIHTTTYGK